MYNQSVRFRAHLLALGTVVVFLSICALPSPTLAALTFDHKVVLTSDNHSPADVAVAADGTIAVSDPSAHLVYLYSPDGSPKHSFGREETYVGDFEPGFMCIDAKDALWVADNHAGDLVSFHADGNFIKAYPMETGSPGHRLHKVAGLLPDAQAAAVYVISADPNAVYSFDTTDGKLASVCGLPPYFFPVGAVWEKSGDILLASERGAPFVQVDVGSKTATVLASNAAKQAQADGVKYYGMAAAPDGSFLLATSGAKPLLRVSADLAEADPIDAAEPSNYCIVRVVGSKTYVLDMKADTVFVYRME
jgi:hypothetical protein